jgi:hypothetical protein
MSTLSTYLSITNNMPRWLSATARSPAVSVATKYFEDNIGKVTSANAFVSNTRLFDYAMTAFGLGDMSYAQGRMKPGVGARCAQQHCAREHASKPEHSRLCKGL